MERLKTLAKACHAGACNSFALAVDFGEAVKEAGPSAPRSPEYKYVLGHLSFLAGESLGPSPEVVRAITDSVDAMQAAPANSSRRAPTGN